MEVPETGHGDAGSDEERLEARVLAHLDELGASYETIRIDPDLAETAAFCAHYGYDLADSANCIVVGSRTGEPSFCACLNLATTKLDVNRTVRKLMGARKASFASPDDTRAVTGMLIGGVTPFGLPDDLPVYVDARVLERGHVIVGGGSRSLKVRVGADVFERLPAATVVDGLALLA